MSSPILKPQTVSGYASRVGTVIACARMLVDTVDTEGGGKKALIILRGDGNKPEGGSSKRHYPDNEWNPYCGWVKEQMMVRNTSFLVSSPYWSPTTEQHNRMFEIAGITKEERRYYLSALISSDERTSKIARAMYSIAATACRTVYKMPAIMVDRTQMISALEYMKIQSRFANEIDLLLDDLQEALDRRNGRIDFGASSGAAIR